MDTIKEIVNKIKTKQQLTKNEISNIISLYCNEKLTDEQILPFIKAIYDYGISDKSIYYLTDAMLNSGKIIDLKSLKRVVDKHSTGGVSDTTTIVITPVCACLNTKMLKLSGRALGFTGGTADKLETFNGYKTDIPISTAIDLVKKNNGVIMTTSAEIAPADKKIYDLRHKNGLVDNIPLIASSIMSKKLACGCDIIVLDVKYGNGAFMKTKKDAKALGKKMKAIGKFSGKTIKIIYGKMNQPLGYNVGAKLETMEAIEILSNKKINTPLYRDCVRLAATCISLDKKIPYFVSKLKVKKVLKSGLALDKLKTMVFCQGGSLDLFNKNYDTPTLVVNSSVSGKVIGFNTQQIGHLVSKQQNANYGIITFHKIGDKVKANEPLFYIYDKDKNSAELLSKKLLKCIYIK